MAVVGVAAVAVLVMAVVRVMRRRLLVVAVRGGSMAPVYLDGDRLLAVRVSGAHRWRVGEDLVFARNEEQVVPPGDPPFLVKRVCAVPGDLVPSDLVPSDLLPSDLVPSDLAHGDADQWRGVNDSISDRQYRTTVYRIISSQLALFQIVV